MPDIVIDIETIRNPNLPDELLDYREAKIRADSRTKDPEKIAAQVAEKKAALYEKDALDPNYGIICCIGMLIPCEEVSMVWIRRVPEERLILETFLGIMKEHAIAGEAIDVITFNGNKFDIPYIVHRCAMLGIEMPNPIASPPYCDVAYLMEHTTYLQFPAHSLTEYAILNGIEYYEDADGKDVQALWDAGRYDEIRRHCESDVRVTYELYKKYRNYIIPSWRGR